MASTDTHGIHTLGTSVRAFAASHIATEMEILQHMLLENGGWISPEIETQMNTVATIKRLAGTE